MTPSRITVLAAVFAAAVFVGAPAPAQAGADWSHWEYADAGTFVSWRYYTWSNRNADSGCYSVVQIRNDERYLGKRFRFTMFSIEGGTFQGPRIRLDAEDSYETFNIDSCQIVDVNLTELGSY